MKLIQLYTMSLSLLLSSYALAANCDVNSSCSYVVRPSSKETVQIMHLEKNYKYSCKMNGYLGGLDLDQDQAHAIGIVDANIVIHDALNAELKFSTTTMTVPEGTIMYHQVNYGDIPSQMNLSCMQEK